MKSASYLSLVLLLALSSTSLFGQNSTEIIQQFLNEHHSEQGLTKSDVSNWEITNHSTSKQSGATHVYIIQQYNGIPVSNGVANFAIKDGKVFSMGNRLVSNLSQKANYSSPSITPVQAIETAAKQLDIKKPTNLRALEPISTQHFIYNSGGISKENIPVKLMYHAVTESDIRLVWDLSIYTLDANHWWSVRVDAQTGEIIDKNDWVIHCNFDHSPFEKCNSPRHSNQPNNNNNEAPETILSGTEYTVFALPLESPNHGTISMVLDPADSLASPHGWHDTNGAAGAEYTITRGNNVFAYDDVADQNTPGFSPDGGAALHFNFPYNGTNAPSTYQSTAITNLFYMNNVMHDVWYRYGFDEASGNFQFNNYGNGGLDDDDVMAEAQDGGGTNNANFATPADGSNPRMQMYLWTSGGGSGNYLDVNSPAGIAGTYSATDATFGPGLPATPITADVVLIIDDTAPVNDGCENITNGSALAGKIVLIDRGNCSFVNKVLAAQNAGAVAVIIANNTAAAPIQMGGTSAAVTIPSIMISQADGNTIKAQLSGTVNATISNGGVASNQKDGDLDNGIIAHEYGHGISTRLSGGASNSNCLSNSEQMGEGWSDWFGLMLTIEAGDLGPDVRGIGTYASNQATTGSGIRPAPYSTSFAVNPYTYDDSNNGAQISEPHGVGFIFATALWDLTWALINNYGGVPDPDIYNGTGGNNIAMQLVIEGLKLQPCNPGMIDGRNAILAADSLLYGGAHQCLIWNVFANRGFGNSASQGSASSRSDQVEAFDLPNICQTATAAPTAGFSPSTLTTCSGTIAFTDSSSNLPQQWYWDFGDSNNSTSTNPSHTYSADGIYTVTLIVTNTIGADTTTRTINVQFPTAPTTATNSVDICAGSTATFSANGNNTVRWLDNTGTVVDTGSTFTSPPLSSTTNYQIENVILYPSQNVGPVSTAIGGGGQHGTGFTGTVNFNTDKGVVILSSLVNAEGTGNRTFFLWDAADGTGNVLQQVTVNVPNGISRINLDFEVPSAGSYSIGASLTTSTRMYRNNSGASYPYTINNLITLTGSSAGPDFYYYLYDLEVQEAPCRSQAINVTANVISPSFTYTTSGDTVAFVDGSTGATSWHWDFGDSDTSTLQNPVHVYAAPGNYTVTLTINNGSCSSVQTFPVLLGVNSIGAANPKVTLMPNPTSGLTSIVLDQALSQDLAIELIDLNGKILRNRTLQRGATKLELNLNNLPAAVYIVQIKGEGFSEMRKLIIN